MQKVENRLRFDKVTESIKVGTFLRHSVELTTLCPQNVDLFIFQITFSKN